jgi:hypothetical protein
MEAQLVGGPNDGLVIQVTTPLLTRFYTARFSFPPPVTEPITDMLKLVQESMSKNVYELRINEYGRPHVADDGTYRYDFQEEKGL